MIGEGEFDTVEAQTEADYWQNFRFIDIRFSETMKYHIGLCFRTLGMMKEFDEAPNLDKNGGMTTWTVVKSGTQLLIQCNGERVLTMDFEKSDVGDCMEKWNKRVESIRFSMGDTASRKHKSVPTCIFEPSFRGISAPKLITETVLPIRPGEVVTLYCDHDWFDVTGGVTLKCTDDGIFDPSTEPRCTAGKLPLFNFLILSLIQIQIYFCN